MAYIGVMGEAGQYRTGETAIDANHDVTFPVDQGELAVILGACNAGKAALLKILAGIDTCETDQAVIATHNADIASNADRVIRMRNTRVQSIEELANLDGIDGDEW
ncbi:ATP-binding cassette domain-containing protein [Bifidobacterium sp. ESL0704]|uniref:ATP-binding cassette domain-containing protein n=1 Tax=Bifidobacterium sp. ESL0704 TaxID=2983219 RepID=UPI0023F7AAA2|nr:ATP-binding cassette domain-containing protein [Bifidobacterium sp. ESL0704]WEV53374.1 ATP-binding cassette domain-containing protein [Bifidobacterium sp. ESL0704]